MSNLHHFGRNLAFNKVTGQQINRRLENYGNGVVSGSGVSVEEYGNDFSHKTVLSFANTPIVLADDAGQGQYGGALIYTFPQGLINTKGAVIGGTFRGYASLIDTFVGFVALGTVTATTGATLTGTEADIIPAVAVAAAVAEVAAIDAVAVATALTESAARWIDGTTTPVPVFLNFLVTDDAAHGAGTALFNGTVTLLWDNLGDN